MSGERDTKHVVKAPGPAEALPFGPTSSKGLVSAFPDRDAAREIRGALSEAIRSIVLPRLIAARRANDVTLAMHGRAVTDQDVTALLSHVTTADHSLSEAMLQVLKLRGVSREDVLLELFQPVARRLGERWASDECSFADVTLAVGRLQRLIRSDSMPEARRSAGCSRGRILIASLPGEQHTFGAAVVDDFFRCSGWDTVIWQGPDQAILEIVAKSAPFDVVGLSIAREDRLDSIKPLARTLRAACSRHLVGILVGGNALEGKATAEEFGVDAIVTDARSAVEAAEALIGSFRNR
jgi:methanogenic corrinoid protein MtbC1